MPIPDDDPVVPDSRLSSAEDRTLRRLHYFEVFGTSLASPMQTLKAELKARDLRAEIREPFADEVVLADAD